MGTVVAAGGKKGPPLQLVAVACSLLGLVLGKYFTLVFFIRREVEGCEDLSLFDPEIIKVFPDYLVEASGPIDILFLVLALVVAFGVPKGTQVPMSGKRTRGGGRAGG
jgi:hypothetical protein